MLKRIFVLFLIIIISSIGINSQGTVDLLSRVLKFEKSLKNRINNKIHIAVVYNNNLKKSATEASNIADKINKLSNKKIQNLEVSYDIYLMDSRIEKNIKNSSVIYIANGVNEKKILEIAKKHKILTIASHKRYIQNVGIVISEKDDKNMFHINVDILKKEGVNIAQELLSISKIYK